MGRHGRRRGARAGGPGAVPRPLRRSRRARQGRALARQRHRCGTLPSPSCSRWFWTRTATRSPTDYIAAGELYVKHSERIDELWNAGPQTYIHGDTHIGNVFLDDGRVGFHDWGLSRVSTPLRDVSYFLTMTVDPEERRRSERDLLRLYLGALRAAGGPDIGFDEALVGAPRPGRLHRAGHLPQLHAVVRRRRRTRPGQGLARSARSSPSRTSRWSTRCGPRLA